MGREEGELVFTGYRVSVLKNYRRSEIGGNDCPVT
jgi:hypothetical protein